MNGKLIKYPGRKWLKHVALWSDPELRVHLPETELFTTESFTQMIERHPILFLKPDLGMKGHGILKVSREDDSYVIRTATKTHMYRNLKSAALKLKQLVGTKKYLVQQGIDLIQIKGSPADFRVLLHIRPNGEWRFFGIMGKVAAKNKFVTNHSSGGLAIRLSQALSLSFGVTKQENIEWNDKLKDLSIRLANAMKKEFPNISELGLDIAIDNNKQIWLIEANTKPQFQLFRYHSNPSLYSKIASSANAIRSSHRASQKTLI